MKLFNPIQSQKASGTFGGLIIYNYNDLTVARNWGKPSGVKTERQLAVESVLTIITRVWSTDLNEGQRTAWRNFAKDFVWTDLWGREFTLKGITLFSKFNFQLLDAGKSLQLTPPPTVNPSEVVISNVLNEEGGVVITVAPSTMGEINSQSTFLDIWVNVPSAVSSITPLPNYQVNINEMTTPQGINPVKSDFRHRVYSDDQFTEAPDTPVPTLIGFSPPVFGNFQVPTRVAVKIRRYNKYGRYSTVQSVSLVTTIEV